jgi:translation initiation factor 2 beta subunit (eIF-2beta)/eIF-5
MNQLVLSEIEQSIMELPEEDQRLLISRISAKLKINGSEDREFELQLSEMAADESIQAELREIAADFQPTELDGLAE